MATETAFRPHVDQENVQAVNTRGGTGRSFGAVKSFQSSNVPLTTPRRALGDVGNTIQPGTAKTRKGLGMKPSKPCGKTPSATKVFHNHTGTPTTKGLSLLQQISSVGLKQSNKQKPTSRMKTKGRQELRSQDPCQRELMYPFSEQEDVLPRANYVSTILKNVQSLYHDCMVQPYSVPDSDLEVNTASYVHFENECRPEKYFEDFLPFEDDLGSLTEEFCSHSLLEIDLPPVTIDSVGFELL